MNLKLLYLIKMKAASGHRLLFLLALAIFALLAETKKFKEEEEMPQMDMLMMHMWFW